jgi:hypothetical protein
MVERTYGVRQSDFEALTSITPGSYFGFFYNGYNYKITYANFISGLGVTGTIVQDGAVTGTPVLDVSGTVNNIRNLENGSGIACSVSVENGITVAHNFTINSTGSPLMLNSTALSPTLVSLVAGSGITLSTASSAVTITASPLIAYASITCQNNPNTTVITTVNTAVIVNISTLGIVGDVSGFTGSTAGRITRTGVSGKFNVTARLSLHPVSGTGHSFYIYIAKNGTIIPASRMQAVIVAGQVQSLATSLYMTVAQSDYLEIYVANATDTTDIYVVNVIFTVTL